MMLQQLTLWLAGNHSDNTTLTKWKWCTDDLEWPSTAI